MSLQQIRNKTSLSIFSVFPWNVHIFPWKPQYELSLWHLWNYSPLNLLFKTTLVWIYSQLLNPTEILVQVKDNSSDEFGSGRGSHSPALAHWERLSKVRAVFELFKGWIFLAATESKSSWLNSSLLCFFSSWVESVQINPIKDLLFHGLARHWGRFLVENWICFGVFSCKFLPS